MQGRDYFDRAVRRSCERDHHGAELDLTQAIENGIDGPEVRLLRGASRFSQGDWNGADLDLTFAINGGLCDKGILSLRAVSRFRRRRYMRMALDLAHIAQIAFADIAGFIVGKR